MIPAYELLINGLTSLKGTGTNTGGLSNYEHGREYYEYLVKDSTGCYDSISDLRHVSKNSWFWIFRSCRHL